MFYYYGRKKKISRHYPAPNRNTIIEPFAGSAAYSLHADNWKRDVVLVEKDSRIVDIWNWLIDPGTTKEDIESLPDLEVGEKTSDIMHIIHSVSKRWHQYKTMTVTKVLATNWEASKRAMAGNLHKVKHWKVLQGGYEEAPDTEAAWFIDPPYRGSQGTGYLWGSDKIDYGKLAKWALDRKGQVMFCEGGGADYLPFEPLTDLVGVAGKRNAEKLFYREG